MADPTALARALREAQDPAATGGDLTVVPYGALAGMRAAFVGAPGHLLFGAASAGSAVVPGQPALLELLDELRAGEVGPGADLFGLLGDPPERSPSPALHNAAFRATGRAALYVPLPGVDPGAALCLPFAGFSVTTPYKSVALARADAADAVAREIGAANTLVRGGDGRWHASNTDALAVAESVPPAGEGGAGAFVYGAGGFAAAAASALRLRGYAVRVGARRPEAARAFAVPRGFPVAGRVYAREPGDRVLVNATPAGADGAEPEFLRGARLDGLRVLDAPYRRAGRTGVAARAEDAGAERVVDGFDLLLRQARGQVRAFGGGDLDPGVLALALRPPLPLLLMGLRGAGKTVVGRAVARRLGRPFVDLDEEVTRLTGRSPGWWIRTQGRRASGRSRPTGWSAWRGGGGSWSPRGEGCWSTRAPGRRSSDRRGRCGWRCRRRWRPRAWPPTRRTAQASCPARTPGRRRGGSSRGGRRPGARSRAARWTPRGRSTRSPRRWPRGGPTWAPTRKAEARSLPGPVAVVRGAPARTGPGMGAGCARWAGRLDGRAPRRRLRPAAEAGRRRARDADPDQDPRKGTRRRTDQGSRRGVIVVSHGSWTRRRPRGHAPLGPHTSAPGAAAAASFRVGAILGLLLALLLPGVLFPAPVAHAQPEEPPASPAADADDLFADLLAGEADGDWRGILNRILQEKDATWIGQVLGRLFRDRETLADHGACAAYAGAYLADHPANGKVLLGMDVVRRAWRDDEFLQLLRGHITKGEGGWDRLLEDARALLVGEDVNGRRAAIWFLAREDGAQRDRVRTELLEALRRDLGALVTGTDNPRGLAGEYLDAFGYFLGYRFASVEEAVKVLDSLAGYDVAGLVLELSRRKDSPDAPLHQRMVDYGKRLVDEAVQGRQVEALQEFLDPGRTPYAAIRRYAVQKAATMAPEPTPAWGALLRLSLAREADPEVLGGALALLERAGFAQVAGEASALAGTLAQRLTQRGPESLLGSDGLENRVRMVRLLGSLKVRPPEVEALVGRSRALEGDVLAELLRALGGMDGTRAEEILEQYRRHALANPKDQAIRVAAADALGRPGIRGEKGDPVTAAAALREILTGVGSLDLGRSEVSEVRQHAIRSLGGYGGEESAEVLRALALGEDSAEARVAIVVLRKTAALDPHAVAALADVARGDDLPPDRRIAAVQALGDLGGAPEAQVLPACEAVRVVLDSAAPAEVRSAAASAAAGLADPAALAPVLAFWRETRDEARTTALRVLLAAVVAEGPENDAGVAAVIEEVAAAGDVDLAAGLADDLATDLERPPLRLARARVRLLRAGTRRARRRPASRTPTTPCGSSTHSSARRRRRTATPRSRSSWRRWSRRGARRRRPRARGRLAARRPGRGPQLRPRDAPPRARPGGPAGRAPARRVARRGRRAAPGRGPPGARGAPRRVSRRARRALRGWTGLAVVHRRLVRPTGDRRERDLALRRLLQEQQGEGGVEHRPGLVGGLAVPGAVLPLPLDQPLAHLAVPEVLPDLLVPHEVHRPLHRVHPVQVVDVHLRSCGGWRTGSSSPPARPGRPRPPAGPSPASGRRSHSARLRPASVST